MDWNGGIGLPAPLGDFLRSQRDGDSVSEDRLLETLEALFPEDEGSQWLIQTSKSYWKRRVPVRMHQGTQELFTPGDDDGPDWSGPDLPSALLQDTCQGPFSEELDLARDDDEEEMDFDLFG